MTAAPTIPDNPLRPFLLRNAQCPKIDELIAALEEGGNAIAGRLVTRVSADGCRNFLAGVRRAKTCAMFRYLAKAGGRQKGKHHRATWLQLY